MDIPLTQEQLDSSYASLKLRVDAWLVSGEAARFPHAGLYRHLPDLFRFLADDALDPWVPKRERASALSAVKYVLAPHDLIPEAVEGVPGFRDDLELAATTTEHLCDACDPVLIAEHWREAGKLREIARAIRAAGAELTGRR